MPRPVLVTGVLLVLILVAFVGAQGLRSVLDPSFQSFTVTPTVDEARERGTLLGEYRADVLVAGAPAVAAAYADRPTRKALGPLFLTRTQTADAVRVVVRLTPEADRMGLHLVFDDGAGVHLEADGSSATAPPGDATTDTSDRVTCCVAFRSRPPERFWLERDGQRLVAFTLDG